MFKVIYVWSPFTFVFRGFFSFLSFSPAVLAALEEEI